MCVCVCVCFTCLVFVVVDAVGVMWLFGLFCVVACAVFLLCACVSTRCVCLCMCVSLLCVSWFVRSALFLIVSLFVFRVGCVFCLSVCLFCYYLSVY